MTASTLPRATFTTMGRAALTGRAYVYGGTKRDTPPPASAPRPERKPPEPLQECGTNAGWTRHRRNNQDPCEPCREAHNAANRAYRRAAS